MFEQKFEVDGKTYLAREEEVTRTYYSFPDETSLDLIVYETDGDALRNIDPAGRIRFSDSIPTNIKPGDKVLLVKGSSSRRYAFEVLEVTRVTKTTVDAGGTKYTKSTGYEWGTGSSYYIRYGRLHRYNEDYVAYMTAHNLYAEHKSGYAERRKKLIDVFNKVAKEAPINLLEEALAILGGK